MTTPAGEVERDLLVEGEQFICVLEQIPQMVLGITKCLHPALLSAAADQRRILLIEGFREILFIGNEGIAAPATTFGPAHPRRLTIATPGRV